MSTFLSKLKQSWLEDPLQFQRAFWPDVQFYDKQREIIYSVRDNLETYVPAGNQLGKDFVAAFIALWFFVVNYEQDKSRNWVRIITTSVKDDHLDVLWGEIGRFVSNSVIPLIHKQGGPLVMTSHEIRHASELALTGGNTGSYLKGRVSAKGEGMQGHHAENTLLIIDEASGVDDQVYTMGTTWAKRILIIGNPHPCNNFFFKGVKAGDLYTESNECSRKVIRVRAEDSPNVRLGRIHERNDKKPTNELIVPGLIDWRTYQHRRATLDPIRQSIGLDGEFYLGAEVLMFPPDWLNQAEARADKLWGTRRKAAAIGVDPAAGGDKTCWTVVDSLGIIEQISLKTPDTHTIVGRTIALMEEYNVHSAGVMFDQGGGGQQHADYMRAKGYPVNVVFFGESAAPEPAKRRLHFDNRIYAKDRRLAYRNRRAQMYGLLRERLDPSRDLAFAIPAEYGELRRQLSVIPLLYDDEGKLYLPSKQKRDSKDTRETLTELIGCSPDEADSLVIALYASAVKKRTVGYGAL